MAVAATEIAGAGLAAAAATAAHTPQRLWRPQEKRRRHRRPITQQQRIRLRRRLRMEARQLRQLAQRLDLKVEDTEPGGCGVGCGIGGSGGCILVHVG
jgi:hypothetical protein